jgi:hypothetical protein
MFKVPRYLQRAPCILRNDWRWSRDLLPAVEIQRLALLGLLFLRQALDEDVCSSSTLPFLQFELITAEPVRSAMPILSP